MYNPMKRLRDENGEESQEADYNYKKPRALPFRTSPTVKHTVLFSNASPYPRARPFLTSDITPVESSEDEDQQPPYPSSSPPYAQSSSQLTKSSSLPHENNGGSQADSDMDMIDSKSSESSRSWNTPWNKRTAPPRPSPFTLLPGPPPRDCQDAALGGRIPTPRWGHFRSVDTSVEMMDASIDSPTPDTLHTDSIIRSQISKIVPLQVIHPTLSYATTVNKSQAQFEIDHSLFVHRRRLPSPISEDEHTVSPTTTGEETLDRRIRGNVYDYLGHSKSNKQWATNERNTALPNSGKTMLSMGFRADCDKCRTRVPGHYNHVVRA